MLNLLTEDSGILECQLDNWAFNLDLYNASKDHFDTSINIIFEIKSRCTNEGFHKS